MVLIEELFFSSNPLPFEELRILIAVAGTAIATYYDVFNNKNVPTMLLYAFVALAFLANLVFYNESITVFGVATAILMGLFGYVFYRMGQLGGADVLVFMALALLLPIHPGISNMPFNFPFVFSVLVFSGLLFALYHVVYYGVKLSMLKDAKPHLPYLLFFVPFLFFVYIYMNSVIFSPVYFSVVCVFMVASIFFLVYREDIHKLQAEKMLLSKLGEEEVLALELMDEKVVKKFNLQRLVTADELKRMKKLKVKDVIVYSKMAPFLPFVLVGIVAALLFAPLLISL